MDPCSPHTDAARGSTPANPDGPTPKSLPASSLLKAGKTSPGRALALGPLEMSSLPLSATGLLRRRFLGLPVLSFPNATVPPTGSRRGARGGEMEDVGPGVLEGKGGRCGLQWSGLGRLEASCARGPCVYERLFSRACLEDLSVTLLFLFPVRTFVVSCPSYSFPIPFTLFSPTIQLPLPSVLSDTHPGLPQLRLLSSAAPKPTSENATAQEERRDSSFYQNLLSNQHLPHTNFQVKGRGAGRIS